MHKRNLKFVAPMAVASAASFVCVGGLAVAAGTRTGGEVHIYEADTALAGTLGTVVLTGAITDHGTDRQGAGPQGSEAACRRLEAMKRETAACESNRIVLSKGTFAIDVKGIGKKLVSLPLDRATCSAHGTVTAPVPIVAGSGTGAYRRIRGTFQTTATEALILPRKNGTSNTNATQYPGVLMAKGFGRVTYK